MKQLDQNVGETMSMSLLWLWDDEANNTQLSSQDISQIALCSMQQILYNVQRTAPQAGKHILIK